MKKSLFLTAFIGITLFCFAAPKEILPVNKECPYSEKAINPDHSVTFSVCCSKCTKKATSNLKAFLSIVKAGNKKCPYSGKPAKKMVSVGFCCSKCKAKGSA